MALTAAFVSGYSTDKNQPDGAGLARTDGIFYNSPSLTASPWQRPWAWKSAAVTNANNAKNLITLWGSYASGPLMIGGGYEQNRQDDDVTAILGTYNLGAFTLGAGYASAWSWSTVPSPRTST